MKLSLRQIPRPQNPNVHFVPFSVVITPLKNLLKLSLVYLPFVSCFVNAVGTQEFQSGSQFGSELLNQGMGGDLTDIFGAPQTNPQESTYAPEQLKERGQARSKNDLTTDLIMETRDNGMKFTIDTATDPLIVRSNQIYENALTEIGGKGTKVVRVEKKKATETATCEESGDPAREVCHGNLNIKFVEKKKTVSREGFLKLRFFKGTPACQKLGKKLRPHMLNYNDGRASRFNSDIPTLDITDEYKSCFVEWEKGGHLRSSHWYSSEYDVLDLTPIKISSVKKVVFHSGQGWWQEGYSSRYAYGENWRSDYSSSIMASGQVTITEEVKEKVPGEDEWLWACDELESRADKGICQYENEECTSGQQTRVINGVKVTRPCWEMKRTYLCSYPSKNDCGPLRAQGCHQIKSTCKKWVGKTCVVHTQTYQCESDTQSGNIERIEGPDVPFCLDGNCVDQSWKTNNEIGEALAQLSLLKELQGQFDENGLSIFSGSDNSCKKELEGFKDCCKDKGWGQSMGLASCGENEKLLAQRKQDKLCHFVGTYCDKKLLGKCIVKKSSYCCFGSKLSRIFHEQGRPQIGLSWGDGKNPVCRGFTLEEIQRIDFSKLDLREIYEEILKRYKSPDPKVLNHKIQERMKVIQDSITPLNRKNPPPQREEA